MGRGGAQVGAWLRKRREEGTLAECELRARREKRLSRYQRWLGESDEAYGLRMYLRVRKLTVSQYDALCKLYDGRCHICGKVGECFSLDWSRSGRLVIDHDHETGEVRGLLCQGCNALLGFARDDVEILHGAIDYLSGAKKKPRAPALMQAALGLV